MRLDRRSFVPLYVQLKNVIERQIASGDMAPGATLESEASLCRLYGVSRITVRQALRGLEMDGLIRREPGRGTFIAARTSHRGVTLGLIFGGLSELIFGHRDDSSFGDVVRGAAEVASQRGAMVHVIPLGDEDSLETLLATPVVSRINGLLVRLGHGFPEPVLRALDATGLPYVVLKRRLPAGRAACVFADDVAGAEAATAHVLSSGHRRAGLLLAPTAMGVSDDRLVGYRLAHDRAGIGVDPDLVRQIGYPISDGGYEGARALLASPSRPSAIFAGSDYIALGVYRALREAGLEPGRDVSVVGYGGTSFSATMYPPLTTISTPGASFGMVGADLLMNMVTGLVEGIQQRTVPWRLVVRQSTSWHSSPVHDEGADEVTPATTAFPGGAPES